MATYKIHAYIIRCLTNLHAGSGDANYGAIDKLVQRDPVTNYPIVHSSGIKGAIREYFDIAVHDQLEDKAVFFKYVFGSEKKSLPADMRPGEFHFFNADLLLLPVRSNHKPFYRATSPFIVNEFKEKCHKMNVEMDNLSDLDALLEGTDFPFIFENASNVKLEDFSANVLTPEIINGKQIALGNLKNVFGENLALCNDEVQMRQLTNKLPVIARNYLENGISQNLWYEEIIPRETRFYFFLTVPDTGDAKKYFKEFDTHVNDKIVQIGANASIGYGACEFTRISKEWL